MKWSWEIGKFRGIGVYMHATFLILIGVIVRFYLGATSLRMRRLIVMTTSHETEMRAMTLSVLQISVPPSRRMSGKQVSAGPQPVTAR